MARHDTISICRLFSIRLLSLHVLCPCPASSHSPSDAYLIARTDFHTLIIHKSTNRYWTPRAFPVTSVMLAVITSREREVSCVKTKQKIDFQLYIDTHLDFTLWFNTNEFKSGCSRLLWYCFEWPWQKATPIGYIMVNPIPNQIYRLVILMINWVG